MSDLAELERRITAALERIGAGVRALPPGGGADGAHEGAGDDGGAAEAATARIARLEDELATERVANDQLSERIKAIKDKQESTGATLERRVEEMTRQLDVQGLELQRMKKTNIQLRETIRAMRDAMEAGLAEPHLVNKSMMAELEALRASRLTEIAEMDEILSGLTPLIARAEEEEADA